MTTEITIELAETDADPELLEQLTYALRDEILETPVDSVAMPVIGEPPEGSRALSILAIGALLVPMKGGAEALQQVVGVVRSWFNRKPAQRTLKITVGDKVLELSAASAEEQQQVVDGFLKRVASG